MQVFRALAGYSLGRADIVRRAMAKKKHEVMRREREFFIYGEKDADGKVITEGAIARGVKKESAEKIFDEMSSFSSYAFNKAHAAAYSFVAYRTAYLKCHYPEEYFSALMTSMMDNASKLALYTAECKKNGIKILPPSVNYSRSNFTPQKGAIRFGLLAIKNLGLGIIEKLISERDQNGDYSSMYDFCLRNYSREFNRKALEGLIKSGALDGLEDNRRQMLYNIDGVLTAVENEKRFSAQGQMNLFDEINYSNSYIPQKISEMEEDLRLELEKEATGLYLTGHPLDKYSDFLKNSAFTELFNVLSGKLSDGKRITVVGLISRLKARQLKNNTTLASCIIEDITASVPVTVFSRQYLEYKELLNSKLPVILTGRISEREDRETELVCEKIEALPQNAIIVNKPKKQLKSGLYLRIRSLEDESFKIVKDLLTEFSGDTPVIIYCTETNKKLEAPKQLYITPEINLIDSLKKVLGEKNVKLVK